MEASHWTEDPLDMGLAMRSLMTVRAVCTGFVCRISALRDLSDTP